MKHLAQESHPDLGLDPAADLTEDMRMAPVIPGARTPGEGHSDYPSENRSHHHDNQQL